MIKLLYVGSRLPSRSETFVYREVLALRALGWPVLVASVHRPIDPGDDPRISQLAREAHVAYSNTLRNLPFAIFASPFSLLRVLRDALAKDAGAPAMRAKIVAQGLAGLCLAYKLRHEGIEHVHAHMAHSATSLAMYAAHALKVPFSFTGHAQDLFVSPHGLALKLSRAAGVVAISNWHVKLYKRITSDLQLVPVVRCGVDVSEFTPNEEKISGELSILAVGRLVPKKGFEHLLRALNLLIQDKDFSGKFHAVIVGGGPDFERLADLRVQLNLETCVTLLGEQPNDRVLALMREADLFVLPCVRAQDGDMDGIPVVLMEAMACGVPVISGDIETIRELVQDHETGLMVDSLNHKALADAVQMLINDSDLRFNLGSAARKIVEQEFSQSVNIERLTSFFENMHLQRSTHAS